MCKRLYNQNNSFPVDSSQFGSDVFPEVHCRGPGGVLHKVDFLSGNKIKRNIHAL